MLSKISTMVQLHQAETATYLTDAIVGIVFFVIILIVANLISWQPGAHDSSPSKRRRWFYILGGVTLFVNLAINYLHFLSRISKVQFQNEYIIHMIIAAIVGVVVYVLFTFIVCKLQKKDTKLASMF